MNKNSTSVEVRIGEASFPARNSMGAMLFLQRDFGINALNLTDEPVDILTYLYCMVKATCIQEKKEFNITLEEFACSLDPEDLGKYMKEIFPQQDAEVKKK